MFETIMVLSIISILLDVNLLIDLRGILFSFLLTKRNRKSANSIHRTQGFGNKLTFKYIEKHTAYVKDFKLYYRMHFFVFDFCSNNVCFSSDFFYNIIENRRYFPWCFFSN